jgi:large-conductance mechanosensitive channel
MDNFVMNKNIKDNQHMKKFIIKYTVLSSIITWIFSDRARCTITKFFDTFIDPLFSVDLNNDGKPDLHKLKTFSIYIGKIRFPIGDFVLEFLKTMLIITLLYYLIKYFVTTDLLNLDD